ncbi:MAG: hypothetical protein HXY22_13250 [Alphaproteobacteria bacterium]|nr:hypothetical protein [Alphaproteobacteria bacterium]
MTYLVVQIVLSLLIASIIGFVLGWLTRNWSAGESAEVTQRLTDLQRLAEGRQNEIDRLKTSLASAETGWRTQLQSAEKASADAKADVARMQALINAGAAEWQAKVNAAERAGGLARDEVLRLQERLAAIEDDVANDLAAARDEAAGARGECTRLQGEMSELVSEAERLRQDLDAAQAANAEAKSALIQLENLARHREPDGQERLIEAEGIIAKKAVELAEAEGRIARKSEQLADAEDRLARMLDELTQKTQEIDRLRSQIAEQDGEVEQASQRALALEAETAEARARVAALEARVAAMEDDAANRPSLEAFAAATVAGPLPPDDLKDIIGIGPVIERELSAMGVRSFRDLARLSSARVEEISAAMGGLIGDRIAREKWVEQAAALHRRKYGSEP